LAGAAEVIFGSVRIRTEGKQQQQNKKAPHQQNEATPSETNTQGTQIPSQSHSS
jgi:hypothetical protein